MWKLPSFMLILLAFGTSAAPAASFECDGLPTSPALARVVTKQARLNFVAGPGKRTPACPSAESTCKLRAYVVPGDEVLVNATEQPYVCASFKASNGTETRGLLPRTALEVAPLGPASAEKWVGTWRRQEGLIEISRDKDQLKVSGNATYGGHDPQRVRRGAINTGELEGSGSPKGQLLAIGYDPDRSAFPPTDSAALDDCAARLQLFGRYLVAEDNGKCGGLNVSFTGIYVRADRR